MKLYCVCSQGPNRMVDAMPDSDEAKAFLVTNMMVMRVGVEQVLADGSRHYPNVDVLQCVDCGRKAILEGGASLLPVAVLLEEMRFALATVSDKWVKPESRNAETRWRLLKLIDRLEAE